MSGGRSEDQSTSNVTLLNPERAPDAADATSNVTALNAPERTAGVVEEERTEARADGGAQDDAEQGTSILNGDLQKQLKEARELLFYATDEGINIERPVIETIVAASEKKNLNQKEAVDAIMSIASLSKTLKDKADKDIRPFIIGVIALGFILIVVSTASFLAGSYSKVLTDEIATANKLALDVNAANGAKVADQQKREQAINGDTETLITLQQFAASIRGIYETSHLLRRLVFAPPLDMRQLNVAATPAAPASTADVPTDGRAPEWRLLELRVPATYGQIKEKTEQYQAVRAYAKAVQDTQTAIYGALTNAILPSLYAILGVCAFLLKTYAEQVRAHTFRMSWSADSARFIIAAIGGGVVGLFSNFTAAPGTSLSLLAVAFLIGYATDIFFTFLDGLEQAFMKGKSKEPERKSDGNAESRT